MCSKKYYALKQIDEDLTARINMADAKFSFQEKGRLYAPAWMAPEALQKPAAKRNWEAADMWSFAILLWELATREVGSFRIVMLHLYIFLGLQRKQACRRAPLMRGGYRCNICYIIVHN